MPKFPANPVCRMEDPPNDNPDLTQKRSLHSEDSLLDSLVRRQNTGSSNFDAWGIAIYLAPLVLNQGLAINLIMRSTWDILIAAA